jgi:ABC-type Zn uptake system ZnuABC Zn-binding protein ZnuA
MLLVALLILSSCGPGRAFSQGETPLVLASTTILADIARNVVGERGRVAAILPVGADPHTFQPNPADVVVISKSTLLLINSSSYESFLEALLENATGERTILEAATGVLPDDHPPANGIVDPHLWLDPNFVVGYVENIRAALIEQDPAGRSVYESNAAGYIGQLQELDAWIVDQVSTVPPERRLLVTNHAALTHFSNRYGFRIVATVIQSGSSEASVSARVVGQVVDAIRESGTPAIFLEASESADVARQIAEETGVIIVDDLHFESLTQGPPAADYLAMMKHNVSRIVEVLR